MSRIFTAAGAMALLLGIASCGGSAGPSTATPGAIEPSESEEESTQDSDALGGFRGTQERRDIVKKLMVGRRFWAENGAAKVLLDQNAHFVYTNSLLGTKTKLVSLSAQQINDAEKRNISRRIAGSANKLVFLDARKSDAILASKRASLPGNIEHIVVARAAKDYWYHIFGFTADNKVRLVFLLRQRERATGTCFAVNRDTIITANHVVKNGISYSVQFEGEKPQWAQFLKYSAKNDLAILRIKKARSTPGLSVPPATLELGDKIFTVGFPQPSLQGWAPKYTEGTISAKTGNHDSPLFFQMSVPVQPGNSGGPVLDEQGRVIGVVTHGLKRSQLVNYAANTKHLRGMLKRLDTSAARGRKFKTRREAIAAVEKTVCKVRVYGQRDTK